MTSFRTLITAFALVAVVVLAQGAVAQIVTLRDIASFGITAPIPFDINGLSQIVGRFQFPGERRPHAFLWDPVDEVVQNLGVLGSGHRDDESLARAINDNGVIVGQGRFFRPLPFPRGGETVRHGALWVDGQIIDINDLIEPFLDEDFDETNAIDVNAHNQVLGGVVRILPELGWVEAPFILDLNTNEFLELGTANGFVPHTAAAMNDLGQVVGQGITADFILVGFLWDDGEYTLLGSLGGGRTSPRDINNAGQIVGTSNDASGEIHGFLWENGVMTDVGGPLLLPRGINGAGQVVGNYKRSPTTFPQTAFSWQDGVFTDLGAIGDGVFSDAAAVNEQGLIAGVAEGVDPRSLHTVIWELVDDLEAPVITVPDDIVLQTLSLDPVAVEYLVTVVDNFDPEPLLQCQPGSGSLFPVGLSMVHCIAFDAAGNSSEDFFNVTIEFIATIPFLIDTVVSMDISAGIKNSLISILSNALNSLDKSNVTPSGNQLAAFINSVNAQTDKAITEGDAAWLIELANAIAGDL